jgi:HAD superfamily hydrolase (TIGR01484 family)
MNQNQVKLIAIDMDGTLLDSQKEIPEENIKAIQEAAAAGIKIVLCTGRPRSGILPHFEKLGLTEPDYYSNLGQKPFDYFACLKTPSLHPKIPWP